MSQMIRLVIRAVAAQQHKNLLCQEVSVVVRFERARLSEGIFRHTTEADGTHEFVQKRQTGIRCHVAAGEIDGEI